jgi:hypothetical protein
MDITGSAVHLSLVSIDVGNLWEVIANALTEKKASWIGVNSYGQVLTR